MGMSMPTASSASKPAVLRSKSKSKAILDLKYLRSFCETLWGDDVHAKRVESLANGSAGALHAASLGIHAIGAGYAAISSNETKHGIKQVDRLLSNEAMDVWALAGPWVRFVLSNRQECVLAMDWTEFDADDQSTICIYLITGHGRATPLLWWSTKKSALKDNRTEHEVAIVSELASLIPVGVRVTLLADRGFGDQALYTFLASLKWDYVIRFRECIKVEDADGVEKEAGAWVGDGRAKMLKGVRVTADKTAIPAVVVVHASGMKDAWCLATSRADLTARAVVDLYGKRFRIEETFRDEKDDHFGMGLRATHIKSPERRDRLLLLAAIAHTMLTLLGAASEAAGLDRLMKANTSKKRTHSLFRQGLHWYQALPNTREEWAQPLIVAFEQIVRDHASLCEVFGVV
jgi:hypothetical protein